MPKIKTVYHRVTKEEKFSFDIWYNSKDMFYVKGGFPLKIMQYVDTGNNYFQEIQQAERHIEAIIKEYILNTQNSREVIIIKLAIGQENISEIENENKWCYCGDQSSRVKGYGLSFNYELATEFGSKENKTLYYKRIDVENGKFIKTTTQINLYGYETFIPLTDENYKFCLDFCAMTNNLSEKIISFFGKNKTEDLIKAIQSNMIKSLNT